MPAYTSSKSAVMGMTKALANEWAKYGINVNAIAPGYMATNNTNQLRQDEERSEEILARIPAGRWGTPADVGGAAILHPGRRRRLAGPLKNLEITFPPGVTPGGIFRFIGV